ncbi:MAG: DUF1667 domain-containing protein [Spirochaetota bacterium]
MEYDKNDPAEHKIKVSGNKCTRGKVYATEEMLSPTRMVTATVHIRSKIQNRLPVKTSGAIQKEYIYELLHTLYNISVSPPVRMGQKIIQDFNHTGIDVIATFELKE